MSSEEKEMNCVLSRDEQMALRSGLAALPDTMPPRVVWDRIREQADAQGLLRAAASKRTPIWKLGLGVAAAAALVVLVMPLQNPPTVGTTEPPVAALTNEVEVNALQALMVESRQLEDNLRSLPDEPRVIRAGTLATISDIEDRIAGIDFQLNNSGSQMTAEEIEIFWRERVRLMKLLVRLRYAQAQRTAF